MFAFMNLTVGGVGGRGDAGGGLMIERGGEIIDELERFRTCPEGFAFAPVATTLPNVALRGVPEFGLEEGEGGRTMVVASVEKCFCATITFAAKAMLSSASDQYDDALESFLRVPISSSSSTCSV